MSLYLDLGKEKSQILVKYFSLVVRYSAAGLCGRQTYTIYFSDYSKLLLYLRATKAYVIFLVLE